MKVSVPAPLLTLLWLCACASTQEAPTTSRASALASLTWIAGSWEGEQDGAVFQEHWIAPAGGMMLGTGRVLKAGRVEFFEYLRLEERGADLFYVASPRGTGTTDFKRVRSADGEAVFENLEHDFPVRIVYRIEPDGSLLTRVEGRDGKGEELRMRRPAPSPRT